MNFDKLKKISEKPWFYPVALFLLAAVTYGYVIPSLGYYWSDWEVVFYTKLAPAFQFGFYAEDRPYPLAYQLIYFLVGSNPIGWQIATLLLRWAGTLFFVYAVLQFVPKYRKQVYWLGALLMVYPGFLQQAQSAAFSRHIMALFLFTLSIYLMALAIRRPNLARFLFPLSWIATFMHLFTIEYFSGIELMRPVLIWVLLANGNKKDWRVVRKAALYSLPYILATAFFFWLRFVYFPNAFQTVARFDDISSTMGGFQGSMLGTALDFFNKGILDLLYSTVQVWTDSITGFGGFTFQRKIAWFAFGVGVVFALAFAFFYNTDEDEQEKADRSTPLWMSLIGLLMFVTSAIPVWAIGKEVGTGGWNVRFSLAPMFGATLLVVGLVLYLVRPTGQKWILGFLLMFSVATQVWTANMYSQSWDVQSNYYWQLYWRIPDLETNTAILSFEYPSNLITHDMDASWAVNTLYHFEVEDGAIPYMFITPEEEEFFQPDFIFKKRARNLVFSGDTSNAVAVLRQTDTSCLRVLDDPYMYDPILNAGHQKLIPISDLSRILPDSGTFSPDTDIFGTEPAHTWCYFFQKADLARQMQDWNEVVALYEQTQELGFTPKYGAEYIPFIQAFAQTGDWQTAYDLSIAATELSPRHKRLLCSNWDRLGDLPSVDMDIFKKIDQNLGC